MVDETASDLASAVRGADLVYVACLSEPRSKRCRAIAAVRGAARPCHRRRQHENRNLPRGEGTFPERRTISRRASDGRERTLGHRTCGRGTIPRRAVVIDRDRKRYRSARKDFAETIRAIGAQPVWCDAETHDWAVGSCRTCRNSSIALAHVVQDETDETGLPLTLAGQGLQDMLRLAGSPYGVWRDIFLTNTDNISRALDRLSQAIDHFRTHLASKDFEQEFHAANELYKSLRKQS